MNTFIKCILGVWLLSSASARSQIQWQVSIKLILDADGQRPPNLPGYQLATPAEIQAVVDTANAILRSTGRGYQLGLMEIIEVAGISQYFDRALSEDARNDLARDAKNETVRYQWRSGVINIYVNGTTNGSLLGICSFPGDNEILLLSQRGGGTTLPHELGHFFNLFHTQGASCGPCDSCGGAFDDKSDHVSDTLTDWACWDQDDIAQNNNLGNSYAVLSAANRERVDNVFFNVMSYHTGRDRLTSGQMDRLTDTANGSRDWAVTGRTRFVDYQNNARFPNGSSAKSPLPFPNDTGGPYPTVAQGVFFAGANDIVLIRTGTYQEGLTLDRPMTLRATRGNAILR